MDPLPPMTQEDYLYDVEWNVHIDKMFIELLLDQATQGNFRVGRSNAYALHVSMCIINKHWQTEFTFRQFTEKLTKLNMRYDVFFWLIHRQGVRFNQHINMVEAEPAEWETIFQKEKAFARAYEHYGDPAWKDLGTLFATDDDDEPYDLTNSEDDVINISSDHDDDEPIVVGLPTEVQEQPPIIIIISSDSEEHNVDYNSDSDSFWREIAEGYASDSGSDKSMDIMSVSSGGFEGPSSTASNSTTQG